MTDSSHPGRGRFTVSSWIAAGLLLSVVTAQEKELPEKYRKWLEEVTYIISDVERETFVALETETEREAFISAFWRVRDTNPATPENEYKIEHYKRLEYANKFLGRDSSRPGWRTDRGRFYILLGPPRTRTPHEAKAEIRPAELWFYNEPALTRMGLPPFFYLLFFRRDGSGEFKLYSPTADGPQALLTRPNTVSMDFRDDVERAYNELRFIDPELAEASLSFRTDEGDTAFFQNSDFGTMELLQDIAESPFYDLDTSYAKRLDFERGLVESDYLFTYVPSSGYMEVLPGPHHTYYLHWNLELDAQHVNLVRDEDRGVLASVFIASTEITERDDENVLVVDSRQESFMSLPESQAAGALNSPFSYSGMTPLIPGAYRARVILRNRACPSRDESECQKSYTLFEQEIEVPEWPKERPALSRLALAYGTETIDGQPLYRPFRFGNVQMLPNPERVYAIGDPLVVGTGALNPPPGAQIRFRVVDRGLDRPNRKVWLDETAPVAAEGPMIQQLSLTGFQGGRYQLEATLVGEGGQVLDTKTAGFDVSPRTSILRPGIRGYIRGLRPETPGVVPLSLGEQYLNVENKEKARQQFEQAIAENFQLGPAREHLAALLLETGEVERAIELIAPVVQHMPERFEGLAILGEARSRRGEHTEAVALLEKAFTLRRPRPHLLNVLARSHEALGHRDRAVELFERSLALNPDQPAEKKHLEELKSRSPSEP